MTTMGIVVISVGKSDKNYNKVMALINSIKKLEKEIPSADQEVFKRVAKSPEFGWFTVSKDGTGYFWMEEPTISGDSWAIVNPADGSEAVVGRKWRRARSKFNSSNWKNSKIKRQW
jgi:hypothetical protein